MLVAKFQTRESMHDGSTRTVLPNAPFLNPKTKNLPQIEKWAYHVIEGTEQYKESMALISEEDRIKYIEGCKPVDPVLSYDDEVIEDVIKNSEDEIKDAANADKDSDSDSEGSDSGNADSENVSSESSEESSDSNDADSENKNSVTYTAEDLEPMDIDVLKDILKENNISFGHNSKKETLIAKILEEVK